MCRLEKDYHLEMRLLFVLASLTTAIMAQGLNQEALTQWRAGYEENLRAPQGWLSLAGLIWLHDGKNAIPLPARCTVDSFTVAFQDGKASVHVKKTATVTLNGTAITEAPLTLDESLIETCGVTSTFIRRGERFGIRTRDPEAQTRHDFHGLQWYAPDVKFRVRATWHPYAPPQSIPITNVLGDTSPEPCPGYAEFALAGHTYRLEPIIEGPELFFLFRDETSKDQTYGSGRFLKAAMPKDGFVILDFNRAYNPPCAYTNLATCPLPPRQNRLATKIEAGEKRYGAH